MSSLRNNLSYDSQGSQSQGYKSQHSGLSQIATQDVFTQRNSEITFSQPTPNNKSMYEKWLNRKASNRGTLGVANDDNKLRSSQEPIKHVPTNDMTPQQHHLSNSQGSSAQRNKPMIASSFFENRNVLNRAKVEEKNERYLLEQMFSVVQESNSEIKSGLLAIKDKLQVVGSTADSQNLSISETVNQFLNDIWKHEDKIVNILEESKVNTNKTVEIETKLAEKDAEIKSLTSQLELAKKGDADRFAQAVRQKLLSPQIAMQKQLEEILISTKDVRENQGINSRESKEQMAVLTKHCSSLYKTGQKDVKELEKHIKTEFEKLNYELNDSTTESKTAIIQEMKSLMQKQIENLSKKVQNKVDSILCYMNEKEGTNNGDRIGESLQACIKDTFSSISGKLETLMNQQSCASLAQLTTIKGTLSHDLADLVHSSKELSSHVDLLASREKRSSELLEQHMKKNQKYMDERDIDSQRLPSSNKNKDISRPEVGRKESSNINDNQFQLTRKIRSTPSRTPSLKPSMQRYAVQSFDEDERNACMESNVFSNNFAQKRSEMYTNEPQGQAMPFKAYELRERQSSYNPCGNQQMIPKSTYKSNGNSTLNMPYVSPFKRFDENNTRNSGPSPVATVKPQRHENIDCQIAKTSNNFSFKVPSPARPNTHNKERKTYSRKKGLRKTKQTVCSPQNNVSPKVFTGATPQKQQFPVSTYYSQERQASNQREVSCGLNHSVGNRKMNCSNHVENFNTAYSEISSPGLTIEELIIHRKVNRKRICHRDPPRSITRPRIGVEQPPSPADTLLSFLND